MRYFLLFLCASIVQSISAQEMTLEKMDEIYTEVSDSIAGGNGQWEMYVSGLPMISIADVANNRMRIITPVSELINLSPGTYKACMEANFHSALDVKYAISDELIWVVYIHPLKELSDNQLKDAVKQVVNGAYTFGTTYSSTNLVFPGKVEGEKRN